MPVGLSSRPPHQATKTCTSLPITKVRTTQRSSILQVTHVNTARWTALALPPCRNPRLGQCCFSASPVLASWPIAGSRAGRNFASPDLRVIRISEAAFGRLFCFWKLNACVSQCSTAPSRKPGEEPSELERTRAGFGYFVGATDASPIRLGSYPFCRIDCHQPLLSRYHRTVFSRPVSKVSLAPHPSSRSSFDASMA